MNCIDSNLDLCPSCYQNTEYRRSPTKENTFLSYSGNATCYLYIMLDDIQRLGIKNAFLAYAASDGKRYMNHLKVAATYCGIECTEIYEKLLVLL